MTGKFEIVSINISLERGGIKEPVASAYLDEGRGIRGDAHAGDWHRQVSLLAVEDIESMRSKIEAIAPGDFAENITTRGIELRSLPVGTRLMMGDAVLEVTQIGKECHRGCQIMEKAGECIMPTNGIFARVIKGGEIDLESPCSYDI